jgi:serine/threonine protein kinase
LFGFSLDGKRKHCSIRQEESRSQSHGISKSDFNGSALGLLAKYDFTQLVDVASGLSYLHSMGLVHGDLKGVRLFSINTLWVDPIFAATGKYID